MQPESSSSLMDVNQVTPDNPVIITPPADTSLPAYPQFPSSQPVTVTSEDIGNEFKKAQQEYLRKTNQEWKRNPLNKLSALAQPEALSPQEAEGAARYTDAGYTYLRGRNNEAVAASKQGNWERFINDTAGFGANVLGSVGSFLLSPVQLVKASVDLLQNGSFSSAMDVMQGERGSFQDSLNRWNDQVQQNTTNFQSDWAAQNPIKNAIPFYGGEGGTDFGSLVRSGGFVVGGIASSAAEAALGTALAPFTEGLSIPLLGSAALNNLNKIFRSYKALEKPLAKLEDAISAANKVSDAISNSGLGSLAAKAWKGIKTPVGEFGGKSVLHGMLINNGEASMEGYYTEKELFESLRNEYRAKYNTDPTGDDLKKMRDISREAGNAAFILNHSLLSVTNHFQLGNILKSFPAANKLFGEADDLLYRSERKAGTELFETVSAKAKPVWEVSPNDKWYLKAFKQTGNYGATFGKSALFGNASEGLEEGLQGSISEGTQDYYKFKYANGGKDDLSAAFASAGKGLQHGFGTAEGLTEVASGILIGAIFGGGAKAVTDKLNQQDQKKQVDRLSAILSNDFGNSFRETASFVKTRGLLGKSLLNKSEDANAGLNLATLEADAAVNGDQFAFQNLKNTLQFSWLQGFVQSGATEIAREQLKTLRSEINRDTESVQKSFGLDGYSQNELESAVQELENHLSTLDKLHAKYSSLYKNPYRDDPEKSAVWNNLYTEMLHNGFIMDTTNKRLGKLKSEVPQYEKVRKFATPAGVEEYLQELEKNHLALEQLIVTEQDAYAQSSEAKPQKTGKKDSEGKEITESISEAATRVQQELDKIRKDLEKQQSDERKRINQQQKALNDLKESNFSSYDKTVRTFMDILNDPMGTALNLKTTEEAKELLQKAHDGVLLETALTKLAEKHDQLTSTKAFDTFLQDTDGYRKKLIQDQLDKEQVKYNTYLKKVAAEFGSMSEATAATGNLEGFADKYYDQYEQTGELPEELTTRINQLKEEKRVKLSQVNNARSFIDKLLAADPEVTKRKSLDPEGKLLDRIATTVISQNEEQLSDTNNLMVLKNQIVAQYVKKLPVEETKPVESPKQENPVTEETQSVKEVQEEEPLILPELVTITSEMIAEKLKDYKLTSARSKISESGMFMYNGLPTHARENLLDSDPVLRAAHEKAVERRVRLMRDYVHPHKPLPLNWYTFEGTDQVNGKPIMPSAPLPDEPGFMRVPTQYMVGYFADETPEDGFIVLPIGESLTFSSQGVEALLNSNYLDEELKGLLADNYYTDNTLFINDFFKKVGDEKAEVIWNALKMLETEKGAPLSKFKETYQEFKGLYDAFRSNADQIEKADDPVAFLNNQLNLQLATSNPFNIKGDKRTVVPVDDLLINSYEGYRSKELGYVFIDEDGKVDGVSKATQSEVILSKIRAKLDGIDPKYLPFKGLYLVVRNDGEGNFYQLLRATPVGTTEKLLDALVNFDSSTNSWGAVVGENGKPFTVNIGGVGFQFVWNKTNDQSKDEKLHTLQLMYETKSGNGYKKYYSTENINFLKGEKTLFELQKEIQENPETAKQWLESKLSQIAQGEFKSGEELVTPAIRGNVADVRIFESTDKQDTTGRSVIVGSKAVFKRVAFQWGIDIKQPIDFPDILEPKPTVRDSVEEIIADQILTGDTDMKQVNEQRFKELGITAENALRFAEAIQEVAKPSFNEEGNEVAGKEFDWDAFRQMLADKPELKEKFNKPKAMGNILSRFYKRAEIPTTRYNNLLQIEQKVKELIKACE